MYPSEGPPLAQDTGVTQNDTLQWPQAGGGEVTSAVVGLGRDECPHAAHLAPGFWSPSRYITPKHYNWIASLSKYREFRVGNRFTELPTATAPYAICPAARHHRKLCSVILHYLLCSTLHLHTLQCSVSSAVLYILCSTLHTEYSPWLWICSTLPTLQYSTYFTYRVFTLCSVHSPAVT